jgi:hypothetical protein
VNVKRASVTALIIIAASGAIGGTANAAPPATGTTVGQNVVTPTNPQGADRSAASAPTQAVDPIALTPAQRGYCRANLLPNLVLGIFSGLVVGPMPGPDTGSAYADAAPPGTPIYLRCGGILGVFQ